MHLLFAPSIVVLFWFVSDWFRGVIGFRELPATWAIAHYRNLRMGYRLPVA